MKFIIQLVLLNLLGASVLMAAERSVSFSALLAPIDFKLGQGESIERKVVEQVVPQKKAVYKKVTLQGVLTRMEEMFSKGMEGKERLEFRSKMRFTEHRVREDSWWDLEVKTPFEPDSNGRWYPMVDLLVDGEVVSSFRMPIHVAHFREVWMLNQNLTRGALVGGSSIAPVVRDVYDQRIPPISVSESLSDYELEKTLSRGRLLSWDDLRPQPQVRRNAIVDVIAQRGALNVRMRARAMEDGLLGDVVTIRNLDTSREFFASVSGKNTVEFDL